MTKTGKLMTYNDDDSTYGLKFHVVCFVNDAIGALANFFLKLEPWSALKLLFFELLLFVYSFLVLSHIFFGHASQFLFLQYTESIGCLFVLLHAVIGILLDLSNLTLIMEICDTTCPAHVFVLGTTLLFLLLLNDL